MPGPSATFPTTRDFVRALEAAGELRRVQARVSPVLEVSALADREAKRPCAGAPSAAAQRDDPGHWDKGGHALLCENVATGGAAGTGGAPGSGSAAGEFPVLINAWGSYRRVEMALGCAGTGFAAIAERIAELVKPQPPRSLREALGLARRFWPLLSLPPKRQRGSGLSQEVVLTGQRVDLTRLPIIRCWPLDGDPPAVGYPAGVNDGVPGLATGPEWERDFRGRYITLGGVHTMHADERDDPKPASHNIGMYRAQLLAKDKLAMHWHRHHDGARHWRSWKALGRPMPVAIALGGESVMPYAATAPLPPGLSELLLAGFLHGRSIALVRGKTVPLWVPASAEIVIEGFVSHEAGTIGWDPRDPAAGPLGPGAVFEGPFGDHTGFYSMPDRYPVMHVTAITHRRDAIYPTTIVGLPPQEDYYLGKATERIFLPLLKTLIPDIEDYHLPLFGAFHNCAFVKIRKHYPLQARRVMHSVWGAGQMAWTKTIFVVDDDVDVHDEPAVLRAAAAHCKPERDLERVQGPLDILDHAAPRLGAGTKVGFDCTRKIPGEDVDGKPLADRADTPPPAAHAGGGGVEAAARTVPGVVDAALHAERWLIVRVAKTGSDAAGLGRRVMRAIAAGLAAAPPLRVPGAALPAFVIVVGPDADVRNLDDAFFHWLAHSDTGRDAEVVYPPGALCVDATPKGPGDVHAGQAVRPWPPIIRMSHDAAARAAQIAGGR